MSIESTRIRLQKILQSKSLTSRQKVDLCQQAGNGLNVVILSCGPSLRDLSPNLLAALSKTNLIFAVKQAHDYIYGIEDVHFINQGNLSKYCYRRNTSVVSSCNPLYSSRIYSRQDLILPADLDIFGKEYSELLAQRLAVTHRYDDYLLSNTIYRPWGPGIMLELVFYFAIHIGCSNIYLAGYDLEDPLKNSVKAYKKFYNEYSLNRKRRLLSQWSSRLCDRFSLNYEYIRFVMGLTYNPAGPMDPDENKLLVDSSKMLPEWLHRHGVRLSLISSKSFAHQSIPRANLSDLF